MVNINLYNDHTTFVIVKTLHCIINEKQQREYQM